MRIVILFILGTAVLSLSCSGTKKSLRKSSTPVTEIIVPEIEEKHIQEPAVEIREVEEKLVPIGQKLPDPDRYFIIIGSFRILENAKKYQDQISKNGFRSVIMKNEAGLYRVSVVSTNDIEHARDEVRRIRRLFPQYYDTWLLIQKY